MEVVKNLATLGKTVVLTTHYMDEAQYLADRVAVIAAGRVVAQGTPATLAGRDMARARIRCRLPDGAAPPGDLSGRAAGDGFTEFVPGDLTRDLHRLTGWAIVRCCPGRPADPAAVPGRCLPAAHRPAAGPRHRPARGHRAGDPAAAGRGER